MQETLSQSEVAALMRGEHVKRKPRAGCYTASLPEYKRQQPIAKAQPRERGTMNRGEEKYAAELESRLRSGQIRWYAFEALKVRLADNTYITPDFAVIADDSFIEFHDVKGRKGDGYWCEEDAKIKLKVLAETFPARVKIVWPDKSGVWKVEVI